MYELDYKYFVLHKLYERLYSLAILDKENTDRWIFYEDIEEGNYTAELKNTYLLSIEERIIVHYIAYKQLKEKYKEYNIGLNGRCFLF